MLKRIAATLALFLSLSINAAMAQEITSNTALRNLAKNEPQTKALILSGTKITDQGLYYLKDFNNLESLSISLDTISDSRN
jgi:hypothetical protein